MRTVFVVAFVAVGLAVILLWRGPLVTRGVNKLAFFLGLVTILIFALFSGGSWSIHIGGSRLIPVAAVVAALLAVAPYVLIVEIGIAGYRGFTSWVRYLCVALSALSAIVLLAAVLLPIILRRR